MPAPAPVSAVARAVEHEAGVELARQCADPGIKIRRHAGRQAAARDDIGGGAKVRRERGENALLVGRCERRAGQEKAVLPAALALDDGEALAGDARHRHADLRHVLVPQKALDHLPGGAADRKHRDASPPSMCTARATLMPPPPGS